MTLLEKYRTENGLTFDQLGAMLQLSRGAAQNLAKGHRAPSVMTLRRIYRVTRLPLKGLLWDYTGGARAKV